jgi:hypothetical protein
MLSEGGKTMRREEESKKQSRAIISAQQIASFVYCAEQWRLESGLGLEPGNQENLAAGERHHAHKAMAERVAGSSIMLGRFLAALAALALLLLLWWCS